MKHLRILVSMSLLVAVLAGCSPEVGSEAWCKNIAGKPKGDWSVNDAGSYAKHCVFR